MTEKLTSEQVFEKFRELCVAENLLRKQQEVAHDEGEPLEEIENKMMDASEEQDWFSVSLGFFAAHGFIGLEAHEMAIKARYTHHYWCD